MDRLTLAGLVLLSSPWTLAYSQPAPRYADVVQALDRFVAAEVADKGLPALSIALVENQDIVWAKGYGLADPAKKVPATAGTVYRAGSVSKLFTAVAVMQLVERGRLDLDAPVTKYLPDFKPLSSHDKPVTPRMLLAHRAGLPREAPVGHYFDDTAPALERTVRSLNGVELVYEPGTRFKYSNAGFAVAGRVVEVVAGQRFARHAHNHILDPLGMKASGFEPSPDLRRDLARAVMWAEHGREFDAPVFELGAPPAGGLYTTAPDLGRFLTAVFVGGRVLSADNLRRMGEVQFEPQGRAVGRGLGFEVGALDGHRRLGHGGNVHGHSTHLAALPDERLGAVVMTSRDFCGGLARRVADTALRQMLAVKENKPPPRAETPVRVSADEARRWEGRYQAGGDGFELSERGGRLWLSPGAGGPRVELRRRGGDLVADDRRQYGTKLSPDGDRLVLAGKTYARVAADEPAPPPARWRGLLGEYGPEHLPVTVLEKDGRLWLSFSALAAAPLREVAADSFAFPDGSLFEGEKAVFTRGPSGRVTGVTLGTVALGRRRIDGEDGATFQIRPLHPVEELRREALKAEPPREAGAFREPDLVEVTSLDATIKLDLRYATDNNFLGKPLYPPSARAYLQRPAAEALARAHKKLAARGYGLLLHDAYRPWHVTKMFWEATPAHQKLFVADPSKGSRHNRGCAIDLTLYDRATGKPVEMVSGYDEFSDRAFPDYPGGTSLQRRHRDLLRRAMEDEGFTVFEAEWWHFDHKEWRNYPILNLPFERLAGR